MTETIPAVLTDEAVDPLPSSMGYTTPGCLVDVHDATGTTVEDDEVGEIVVGGERGITLFAGYLDDPATTAASFDGDWFRTGDRARRDADGRYFFDGRRADLLKVAGENVSTVEVEQVLAAHPAVLEVAVIGMPDPVRDEVPVAFVVAADPALPPSSQELFDWCTERLTKSKRPRDISFVDELPRTSVGKIRKFLLKDPTAEVSGTKTK
jgi:crotonobetaine/carnitine-CoA ligase